MKKFLVLLIFSLFINPVFSNSLIQLTGKIDQKSSFGPPNYGETPDIDKKEIYYCLSLDKLQKVEFCGKKVLIKNIQLIFNSQTHLESSIVIGEKYIVYGYLQFSETGHHHTDCIFIVEDLKIKHKYKK